MQYMSNYLLRKVHFVGVRFLASPLMICQVTCRPNSVYAALVAVDTFESIECYVVISQWWLGIQLKKILTLCTGLVSSISSRKRERLCVYKLKTTQIYTFLSNFRGAGANPEYALAWIQIRYTDLNTHTIKLKLFKTYIYSFVTSYFWKPSQSCWKLFKSFHKIKFTRGLLWWGGG